MFRVASVSISGLMGDDDLTPVVVGVRDFIDPTDCPFEQVINLFLGILRSYSLWGYFDDTYVIILTEVAWIAKFVIIKKRSP